MIATGKDHLREHLAAELAKGKRTAAEQGRPVELPHNLGVVTNVISQREGALPEAPVLIEELQNFNLNSASPRHAGADRR